MDACMAFVAGAAGKLYDDGVDMKYITNQYHIKILETLQCMLLGAISINSFTFTVVNLIINLLNYISNGAAWSAPYESSLLVVFPIFLLLSIGSREYLTVPDMIVVVYLAAILFFEPFFIKEETSPRKFVFRLLITIIIIFMLLIPIGLSNGIYLTLLYCFGYLVASSIYQGYSISHMSLGDFIDELITGTIRCSDPILDLFK